MTAPESSSPAVASVGSLGAPRRPYGDAPRQTPRQVPHPPPPIRFCRYPTPCGKKGTNHLTKRGSVNLKVNCAGGSVVNVVASEGSCRVFG